MLILVRHAHAGKRDSFDRSDSLRELTPKGRAQAKALAKTLSGYRPEKLIASPYVRCMQTLEPLSSKLKIPLRASDALGEGSSVEGVLELEESDLTKVACSHGDVIPAVLQKLAEDGFSNPGYMRCSKASIWVVDFAKKSLTYIEAPEVDG